MDAKTVCMELLTAESEAEVEKIIAATPDLRDKDNWEPLDGRDTNFNITSNQASDGGKALTELMTNMVDAVLMKHVYQKGVDPTSPAAPKTMYEAVDNFVKNMHGGGLVNLDPKDPWLNEFALKNLVIGITGARSKKDGRPCYTFVDNGEGQHGKDFERTFLSLSAGHKRSIPFVQGKFNMGSSGVLPYCGLQWFKLIISRRYDGKGDWAWTLLRRRPGDRDSLPVAEYFIMKKEEIPSFELDYLYPFETLTGNRYDRVVLKTGTIVKLFDYEVGSNVTGFSGPRETLNENLVDTVLPFRLLDFRQLPKSNQSRKNAQARGRNRAEGVDPRPFFGMKFLLLHSHKEEGIEDEDDAAGEGTMQVANIRDPKIGKVLIYAISLKRKLPSWLKAPKNNNRVFHTVNGQVQFKKTRGYLTECGFPALKDRVVIVVDASNLVAHNEIWKGDREHVRKTIIGGRYLELIKAAIKESESLKELENKVAKEDLEYAIESEGNDLFQKLVNSDSNFAGLLSQKDPKINLPTPGGGNRKVEPGGGDWDGGKKHPTFLKLEGRRNEGVIEIPLNSKRPVAARTDAENGYLNRPDNTGHVLIDNEICEKFGIRETLNDGRLTVFFEPSPSDLLIGESFSFKIGLKDDGMPVSVESEELTFKIVDDRVTPPSKSNKKPKKPKGTDNKNAPTLGLPKFILLTEDGRDFGKNQTEKWPDDFTKNDGGEIRDITDGEVIYCVNFDNAYHLKYRRQQRNEIARDALTEKYILGMRILMLGYQHALKSYMDGNDDAGMEEFVDEFRRMAARGAASTVLALAENLPKIVSQSGNDDDVE